jgi:hypothetical protein
MGHSVFPNQQYKTDSRFRFPGCMRLYRDPMQRLNGSGKDSLEQTLKQRLIMDTCEFRRRMENGRSNTDSMVLTEGVPAPPEINIGLFGFPRVV